MSKKITDEDIEQGIAKVERMNAMFDKAIIPVLFIAALAVFLFGALPKLIRHLDREEVNPQVDNSAVEYVDELTLYEQRSRFMDMLDENMEKAQAEGYSQLPEEFGVNCIHKQYDENTIVAHFYDGSTSYGKVIAEGLENCEKVEVRVYTANRSTVIVTLNDGTTVSAKFSSIFFTADETLTDTDTNDRLTVLKYASSEELSAIRAIYDRELEVLLS